MSEACDRIRAIRIASWGSPSLERTYRGVPRRVALEMRACGISVDEVNLRQFACTDVLRGAIDWPRSLHAGRLCKNQFWRFLPENIERLTKRYMRCASHLAEYDAALQFGVAGISGIPMVAHVEMSVAQAAADPIYSRSYGFRGVRDSMIERAIAGERMFLGECRIVWTNSAWTGDGIRAQGVPAQRVRVCPPACGLADPGPLAKDWRNHHILFVAADWEGKGGPLLIDALRKVREKLPDVRLTIAGCAPDIDLPNVEVVGFLHKDVPSELSRLLNAYRSATLFCMPTKFDTTGIVFFEAALYGMPSVMLAGQGREQIFPSDFVAQLGYPDPDLLAQMLIELLSDAPRLSSMGQYARKHVLEHHTWRATVPKIIQMLNDSDGTGQTYSCRGRPLTALVGEG